MTSHLVPKLQNMHHQEADLAITINILHLLCLITASLADVHLQKHMLVNIAHHTFYIILFCNDFERRAVQYFSKFITFLVRTQGSPMFNHGLTNLMKYID